MGLVDFSRFPRRIVLCIDVKSFFASVEVVWRGLILSLISKVTSTHHFVVFFLGVSVMSIYVIVM